jgi:hypothetical protein
VKCGELVARLSCPAAFPHGALWSRKPVSSRAPPIHDGTSPLRGTTGPPRLNCAYRCRSAVASEQSRPPLVFQLTGFRPQAHSTTGAPPPGMDGFGKHVRAVAALFHQRERPCTVSTVEVPRLPARCADFEVVHEHFDVGLGLAVSDYAPPYTEAVIGPLST